MLMQSMCSNFAAGDPCHRPLENRS